jgi:hypothetical protein
MTIVRRKAGGSRVGRGIRIDNTRGQEIDMTRLALIAFVAGLCAAPALADGPGDRPGGNLRGACRADIEKHCAGIKPGDGRLRHCVREHHAKFSQGCKTALREAMQKRRQQKADTRL